MQLSVESPVSNDTVQRNTHRNEIDGAVTETDTTTQNQCIPNASVMNTNTKHENGSIASQVSDKDPFYSSQRFRGDRSNFSAALGGCWGEYIAEYNYASKELGLARDQDV